MARETLGEFEQLVLLAALQLGDEAYAVPICEQIHARTGRDPSHAAVYVALRRLESKGLVESRMGGSTPERGGRARRFVTVNDAAREMLRESRDALLSMWEGIEETSP